MNTTIINIPMSSTNNMEDFKKELQILIDKERELEKAKSILSQKYRVMRLEVEDESNQGAYEEWENVADFDINEAKEFCWGVRGGSFKFYGTGH